MNDLQLNKIKKDPYYSSLFDTYGLEYIKEAGFFFDSTYDNFHHEVSLMLPCTPLNHIRTPSTNKHCVIVTSGAMCPPHDGHIEMMIAAKVRLEAAGFEVLGGYIAPDHNNYVYNKNLEYAMPIEERLYLTTKKIWQWEQQEWLSVDPWYGLFTPTDLNFTDLLDRSTKYIKKYRNIDTELFYVCGGDRHAFSKTFANKGGCVVVARAGTEIDLEEKDNVFVAYMDNDTSSTALRNRLYYKFNRFEPATKLKLRADDTTPVPFMQKYYKEVDAVPLEYQRDILNTLDLNKVISLDPCLRGSNYLQVSRDFDLYGHNKSGYYLKDEDLNVDTSQNYVLFDDDIYSGGTMRFATEYLKNKGISIRGYFTLSLFESNAEIQDNRDFVLFEESGGLMVSINGKHVRAPYAYPFVDPMMRCSVSNPVQFSLDVWKFNYELHKDNDKSLNDVAFDTIYELIGFDKSTPLKEICKFYLDTLQRLSTKY